MKRSASRLISFSILPIAMILAGLLYTDIIGPYFVRCVDPEFAYLTNGLLIADLKLHIGFFSHPGTPVQCVAAGIIRIVHLFRPGHSMVQDVLLNPELYIRAIVLAVSLFNAVALFLLGFFAYKITQNLILALFIQLTPFTHGLTLSVMGRLMPEPLMNILVCGWIILMLRLIFLDSDKLNFRRYAILFGLLFGISLADKLTFLPFILIPIIVLSGWKNKLIFILSSAGFFFLFAFPVTLKLPQFYDWVKTIFIHTGNYGSGDRGIINWNEFTGHLRLQLASTGLLKWVFLVLVLMSIFYLIIKRKSATFDPRKLRAGIALILVIGFEYLLTSKHFAFHYMIPAILLTAFAILLILLFLKDLFPGVMRPVVFNGILVVSGFFILFLTTYRFLAGARQVQQIVKPVRASYSKVGPLLHSSPKILSVSYYGCDAVEYALTFGIHESGRYSQFLTDNLKELYPSTVLYFPWSKVFYEGIKETKPSDFIKPGIDYTLYIAEYTKQRLDEIMEQLTNNPDNYNYIINPVYVDSVKQKGVFTVKFQQSR
jgi:hypothetical protein